MKLSRMRPIDGTGEREAFGRPKQSSHNVRPAARAPPGRGKRRVARVPRDRLAAMTGKEAGAVAITTKTPWTADELKRLPDTHRYEIDEGELVIVSPAGRRHARMVAEITHRLTACVRQHNLGEVGAGELGIYLQRAPQTLRGADIAYFSTERVKQLGDTKGFVDVPPDLVVEVHLPDEYDMPRKVEQYLRAGVRAVWVVDPDAWTLTRHAPGHEPRRWQDPASVVEEPLLAGFGCPLGELLGTA